MILRKLKKLVTKKFLVGALLGAMLSAALLIGCTDNTGPEDGRDADRATVSQSISEGGGSPLSSVPSESVALRFRVAVEH